MEILRVALAAGERKSFHKEGTYLEVMKATAPFNVHFTDRAKGVFPCIGLEAGVYSEMPFQMMEVESDTAQTVTLMISSHRAGFRAGGAVAGVGGGAPAYPTAILWDDSAAVAAFTAAGGRVSGAIKGMAPSAVSWMIFDLGVDYQSLDRMLINCKSDLATPVNVYGYSNETAVAAGDVVVTYKDSPSISAFGGTFNANGNQAIVQPAGRFLSLLIVAGASGTGPAALLRLQRHYK
jgi:hypothetical protein